TPANTRATNAPLNNFTRRVLITVLPSACAACRFLRPRVYDVAVPAPMTRIIGRCALGHSPPVRREGALARRAVWYDSPAKHPRYPIPGVHVRERAIYPLRVEREG